MTVNQKKGRHSTIIRYHRLGDLTTKHFSSFLEAGKSEIKVLADFVLVGAPFLLFTDNYLFIESSPGGRGKRALCVLLERSLISFMRPLPPNIITLRLGFQHVNLGETRTFNP